MARIAFVTHRAAPGVASDDRLLLAPLERLQVQVEPVPWDAPDIDWNGFDAVILRSTWDYHRRAAEFSAWLDARAADGVPVHNPVPVVRWNLDKSYLLALRHAGVPIVPTRVVPAGDPVRLSEIFPELGWERAVVKPAISASAWRTRLVNASEVGASQGDFGRMVADTGALVQEYFAEIETAGEWSLMFAGGQFSHAARKRPKRGDFRVQEAAGGMVEPASAPTALIEQGRRAVQAAPDYPHLYARVDGIVRNDMLHLMELELIEPSLFLGCDDAAPERFAKSIEKLLKQY